MLRGYPFTAVLALTIVVLAGVATVRRLKAMARRWETEHVPIIVKLGAYEQVLGQLRGLLTEAGLEHEARPADAFVSSPPKLLDAVGGRALGELVPDRLMVLHGRGLEILVYPSDVAVSGTRGNVARARAAVASRLTDAEAYMTASGEAQKFEDDLQRARRQREGLGSRRQREGLRPLDERLARLAVPFEEWETLYRQRLQVELEHGLARSPAPARPARRSASAVDLAIAAGGLALIALDVALLLVRQRANSRHR